MTQTPRPDVVDLRSDTVTRPSEAMRRAMADAAVGDVCWGDDPTVNRFEARAAERLGKEAAIYVPSGSMGNQIGLAVHTRRGDAVFCERRAHIARWEGGGAAASSGLQLAQLDAPRGLITPELLDAAAFADFVKAPRMSLLALENTHNGAGGAVHRPEELEPAVAWARARTMAVHLDGARVFNAAVALSTDVANITALADTVSVCFSKGLGAPIGSVIAGSKAMIEEADRIRHRLGGGWRQAGVLAAAAEYALDHHIERLADDHARARQLAEAFVASGVARPSHRVESNLVYLDVATEVGTAAELVAKLAASGILVGATGAQTIRIVTHLDVDDGGVQRALTAIGQLA